MKFKYTKPNKESVTLCVYNDALGLNFNLLKESVILRAPKDNDWETLVERFMFLPILSLNCIWHLGEVIRQKFKTNKPICRMLLDFETNCEDDFAHANLWVDDVRLGFLKGLRNPCNGVMMSLRIDGINYLDLLIGKEYCEANLCGRLLEIKRESDITELKVGPLCNLFALLGLGVADDEEFIAPMVKLGCDRRALTNFVHKVDLNTNFKVQSMLVYKETLESWYYTNNSFLQESELEMMRLIENVRNNELAIIAQRKRRNLERFFKHGYV